MKRMILGLFLLLVMALTGCQEQLDTTVSLNDYLDLSSIGYTYELNGLNYDVSRQDEDYYFIISEQDKTYEVVIQNDVFYGKKADGSWYLINTDHPNYDLYVDQIFTFNDTNLNTIELEYTDERFYVSNPESIGPKLFNLATSESVSYLTLSHHQDKITEIVVTIENASTNVSKPYRISLKEASLFPTIEVTTTSDVAYEDLPLYPNGVVLTTKGYMQAQAEFGTVLAFNQDFYTIEEKPQYIKGQALEITFLNGDFESLLSINENSDSTITQSVELTTGLSSVKAAYVDIFDAVILTNEANELTISKAGLIYTIKKSTTIGAELSSALNSLEVDQTIHIESLILSNGSLYITNDSAFEVIDVMVELSFIPGEDTKRLVDIANDYNVTRGIPSKGNPKLLIIPIAFTNYPAPSNMKQNLEKALFGTALETGFQSLQSYYYLSSYGSLLIEGTVLEPFQTNKTSTYYENQYLNGNDSVDYDIMESAIAYYNNTIDYSIYDSDGDSYIDGIMLVYTAPVSFDSGADLWWAYVYQYYEDYPTKYDGVEMNFYMFVGYEFIDEIFNADTYQSVAYNATTFIHEMGHLLGLDDYYDYEPSVGPAGGIGGGDMMDYAVGDHNAFSKLLLGWITPQVSNKTSGSFTLKPFESSGEALIIPRNWTGSFFDEYLIIDYFTPTGINSGHAGYNGLFSTSGIRIYHISAELNSAQNIDSIYTVYKNNNTDTTNKLIKLIEADGRNDISNTKQSEYGLPSENSDLFKVNQSLQNYKWYNGSSVGFTLTVTNLTAQEATFTVTFN